MSRTDKPSDALCELTTCQHPSSETRFIIVASHLGLRDARSVVWRGLQGLGARYVGTKASGGAPYYSVDRRIDDDELGRIFAVIQDFSNDRTVCVATRCGD